MQPDSDARLLRQYAEHGKEDAFAEIVTRHTNLVYSAALRQARSRDVAADVAQQAFIGLARRAPSLARTLPEDASLAGWLCRSARNILLNLRRDEFRRHTRERQVMADCHLIPEPSPDWEQLNPILDEVMAELNEPDYDALVLRFYKNHNLRSVGIALGTSDDAAQKRISRALEKLRDLLSRRGINTSAAALAATLSASAVHTAPVGLNATISTAVTLLGKATGTVATTTHIVAMTTFQKALISAGIAIVVAIGVYQLRQASTLSNSPSTPGQQQATLVKQQAGEAATHSSETEPEAAIATESQTEQVESPQAEPEGNYLQVIVQDENSQPLERADVLVAIRDGKGYMMLTNFNRTVTTTSRGIAGVQWPAQDFTQLDLYISKDGYAPRSIIWDVNAGDEIPSSYSVKLKDGVHVGGVVVDPEGNPVTEANVTLLRFWKAGEDTKKRGEAPAFSYQKHTTGSDGRWSARNLPSELLNRIIVSASHTNFRSAQLTITDNEEMQRELRAGTHKLTLERGFEARGLIVNEQQQPIADAKVWAGRNYFERQETKSDERGRFTFHNLDQGMIDFIVVANGYTADTRAIAINAEAEEIVFQLTKGGVIRGQVQDQFNQPIEGVRVVLEGSPGPAYDTYEFSTKTDAEGRFEWTSAPDAPMPFYFGKSGYQQKRRVQLKPNEENIVTMQPTRQVQGQVLDAETEKPVTRFTISAGHSSGKNWFTADSISTKAFKNEQGLFTLDIEEESQNGIRATAADYADQTQALPPAGDGQAKVVFKLKPAPALVGLLVNANQQPVEGADVGLVEDFIGGKSIQFSGGRLRPYGSKPTLASTDASGRFSFPSPPEAGTVVAADGTGFGLASIAEIRAFGILTLRSFGRIEGILMRDSAPNAGQELSLSHPNERINFELQTTKQTTDTQGHFAFENVPAGTISIIRIVKVSTNGWGHSHRTDVVVNPGQTTQIVLGGVDATLHGRVRFETAPSDIDYTISAQLSTAIPPMPEGLTADEITTFLNSPQRKEQKKAMKFYSATVADDGSLVWDSIPPGEYTLRVKAVKKGELPAGGSKPLAESTTTITVPEGADPSSPLQIGDVVLTLSK